MSEVRDISRAMREAQENMISGDFMRALTFLSRCKDFVREELQKTTSSEIKEIIRKLGGSDPLIPKDIEYIRLWIIGDAESYTTMENNFQDWLNEFKRLTAVVAGFENKQLAFGDLLKLHGILEDAVRVSADIGNYLEKKERIRKFEDATATASLDREILKKLLESKLQSPEY